MALDLKPLADEVIEQMGWSSHDLWLVKYDNELYGPFEIESLKHYAHENEAIFEKATATRMDANNWQPFFNYTEFQNIAEQVHVEQKIEKYWILNLGQKAGPFTRREINKKMELEILSLADLVSLDNGETWNKFYQLEDFNPHQGADELPMAPLESSFQRAREELEDWMDSHEKTGSHTGLASLIFMSHQKEKPVLNLDEIDLKSLNNTEVSHSLKWAIPGAFAAIAVFATVGHFVFSPSTPDMDQLAEVEKQPKAKSRVIMPKPAPAVVQRPPEVPRPANRPQVREPASYQRSELTRPQATHSDVYPSHVETHSYNEPDPMMDPPHEADIYPPQEQPQEHSLVSNQLPQDQYAESLDAAMGGSENPMPEQPVIEEASDF